MTMDNQIDDNGALFLADISSITDLNLAKNQIGDTGAKHISTIKLTSLDLSENSIGEMGAQEISNIESLTSLNLASNQIGIEGARLISGMPEITNLNLANNQIRLDGTRHITNMQKLTTLDLSENQIGDAGAQEISKIRGLTTLNLNANQIGDAGAQYISHMQGLTTLDLRSNQITDVKARQLSNLCGLTSFLCNATNYISVDVTSDEITLVSATITDADFANFFQSNDFGMIKKLKISHSKIDPELFKNLPPDLKALSLKSVKDLNGNMLSIDQFLKNTPYENNLEDLSLENQYIDDSAASVVTEIPRLKNLNLSTNQITAEGFLKILALRELQSLDLSHNQIKLKSLDQSNHSRRVSEDSCPAGASIFRPKS